MKGVWMGTFFQPCFSILFIYWNARKLFPTDKSHRIGIISTILCTDDFIELQRDCTLFNRSESWFENALSSLIYQRKKKNGRKEIGVSWSNRLRPFEPLSITTVFPTSPFFIFFFFFLLLLLVLLLLVVVITVMPSIACLSLSKKKFRRPCRNNELYFVLRSDFFIESLKPRLPPIKIR